MATERDLELLDDYLSNRMKGQEREQFEQRLTQDPSLHKEYIFQKQVFESLRHARMQELKQMLNNTPVSPGGNSQFLKIASAVFVAGVVGVTAYFVVTKPAVEEEQYITDTTSSVITEEKIPAERDETRIPDKREPIKVTEEDKNEEKPEAKPLQEEPTSSPITVFDPTDELTESTVEEPKAVQNKSNLKEGPSITVETDSNNRKYDFHYQFTKGKLVLYGKFERNLYEILEFFSNNEHTRFLYYRDKYYLLDDEDGQVKSLVSITDPELLKKLAAHRKN